MGKLTENVARRLRGSWASAAVRSY